MPSSDAVYTLRLVINREDDLYTGRWIETDGQESGESAVTPPLAENDMAELRWYLETFCQFPGTGDHTRAAGIQARLNGWERTFSTRCSERWRARVCAGTFWIGRRGATGAW